MPIEFSYVVDSAPGTEDSPYERVGACEFSDGTDFWFFATDQDLWPGIRMGRYPGAAVRGKLDLIGCRVRDGRVQAPPRPDDVERPRLIDCGRPNGEGRQDGHAQGLLPDRGRLRPRGGRV